VDIEFGPAGDDNLEPGSVCSCIGQDLQEAWAISSGATLVESVNDKDEGVLRLDRKGANEIKEEGRFHRLRSQVWVVTKVLRHDGSKRREEYGEFVDKRWKNVGGLAQRRVVPPTKKGSSKLVSLVEVCADGMGQRRFPDSG